MKVLLRDLETDSYSGISEPWVRRVEEAEEFKTLEDAGRKASEIDQGDLVVVLRYEKPSCELALNPAYCVPRVAGGGPRLTA